MAGGIEKSGFVVHGEWGLGAQGNEVKEKVFWVTRSKVLKGLVSKSGRLDINAKVMGCPEWFGAGTRLHLEYHSSCREWGGGGETGGS